MQTVSIPVRNISIDYSEQSGLQLDDDGFAERQIYSELVKKNLLSSFTTKQRRVLACLYEQGMSRRETALHLIVSLQSIHQIVARMKQRVLQNNQNIVRNLVYFFWLNTPDCSVETLLAVWTRHPVLRDYPIPDEKVLLIWQGKFRMAMHSAMSRQM